MQKRWTDYWKTLLALASPVVVTVTAALNETGDGGAVITGAEWGLIAGSVVGALAVLIGPRNTVAGRDVGGGTRG